MRIRLSPSRLLAKVSRQLENSTIRRNIASYDFGGFRRIYHFHIRKTGGTSVTKMFMHCEGNDGSAYAELNRRPDRPSIQKRLVFVRSKELVEKGNYFFGFSHRSFDQVSLPPNTFTFTCFRDPARRLMSHYNMLLHFSKKENPHPCFETEGKWVGETVEDFLDRVPREHLQNQLFMFSEKFCVAQAIERIRSLNFWMFTEQFDAGVSQLSELINLNLRPMHQRKSPNRVKLRASTRERLREMLADEYTLLDQVRQLRWDQRKRAG